MPEYVDGIHLCVGVQEGCDLALTNMRTLAELAQELEALMDTCRPEKIVRLALLPPFPSQISVRSALKTVVEVWSTFDPARRKQLECVLASPLACDLLAPYLPGRNAVAVTFQCGTTKVCVTEGDICAVRADAIVNASNTQLRLGGGVSAAIRDACGPTLAAEMAALANRRPLADGDAVVTGSHGLQTARHIIHAA